jgi:glucose/arabinose dehydrogenase
MGHGQNIKSPLGAVLRIDVDSEPDEGRPYAIPPGNLFADGSGAGETYAYGFRNPYRFSFDDGPGGDGALYVADVGQDQFEEIDIVVAGGNYGWVLREGFDCFDPFNPGTSPATCDEIGLLGEPLLDPVLVYDHSVGLAVIGGFVYRGTGYPPLQGKYVFGDFSQDFGPTGRLFYTDIEGASAYELREFFIAPDGEPLGRALFGIGEDEDGEVYVLASGSVGPVGDSGVVYRIVPPA